MRGSSPPALAVAAASLLAVAAAGCQSTQDKAAALQRGGSDAFKRDKLAVGKPNPNVKVISTTVVPGAAGAAVVVRMRNASKSTFTRLPVAIDVRDGAQRSIFRNDAAGAERSLIELALLRPGQEISWVNDQVPLQQGPKAATARVGTGGRAATRPPQLRVQGAKLGRDGDAWIATGFVRNDSAIEQRELIVYAVARRAGRVVAAGRGQIVKLKARARASFTVFFTGDARGAKLEFSAPPTVLKGGSR